MHQNNSLWYLGFEWRPGSCFCWKARSLHHTIRAKVKVFNPQPSTALLSQPAPRLYACQSKKLADFFFFFSFQFRSKPKHCFPTQSLQKHDRCPWKQESYRCFRLFQNFIEFLTWGQISPCCQSFWAARKGKGHNLIKNKTIKKAFMFKLSEQAKTWNSIKMW